MPQLAGGHLSAESAVVTSKYEAVLLRAAPDGCLLLSQYYNSEPQTCMVTTDDAVTNDRQACPV